jgi:iron complex transport system substrate-binding protein
MIKKIVISVMVLLLLWGCTNVDVNTPGDIISDALGREVSLQEGLDRIVIAGKQTPTLANFAYMFDPGFEKVIAIENRSQSSNNFLSLIDPQFVGKLAIEKGASAEQISPTEPDAVILMTSMKEQIGDQLELVGISPVYVSFETIEEIYRDIRIFGSLLNDSATSEKIVDFYSNSKNEIDQLVSSSELSPRTLILQIEESEGNFVYSVPSASWLQTTMVDELMALPVWKDEASAGGWMEVSLEQVIVWQPEIVIVVNYQGRSVENINKIKSNEVWSEFLENSNVMIKPFAYDYQSWDQPDPRWILGYANLAHYLHPDAISANFLYDLVRVFYSDLYGLDLEFINSEIISLVQSQIE